MHHCTGTEAHRGSRCIDLPFLDHGTRRRWGVSVTPWPLFTSGKDPVPLNRGLCGPHGQSGQVRKISPPTGIRSPDRSARSQSLYRLRYPDKSRVGGYNFCEYHRLIGKFSGQIISRHDVIRSQRFVVTQCIQADLQISYYHVTAAQSERYKCLLHMQCNNQPDCTRNISCNFLTA